MKYNFKKMLVLLSGALLITLLIVYSLHQNKASMTSIQQSISNSIVRFHVISAGDSDAEQGLKILVKNAVIDMLEYELCEVTSKEETLKKLSELTPDIIALAENVLKENGSDLSVSAAVYDDCFFPIKNYGDLTLPAGKYTAYRIILGEGEGTNWWCVLYPRLCFVDAAYGVVPDESKEEFHALLDETEYDTIFGKEVKFKFKFLTFLNELF